MADVSGLHHSHIPLQYRQCIYLFLFPLLVSMYAYFLCVWVCYCMCAGEPTELVLNCSLISFDKEKESEEVWRDGKGEVTKGQVIKGHGCKHCHTVCVMLFFHSRHQGRYPHS